MTRGWVVHFGDQHQLQFDAVEVEACSGSGVLRATNAAGEVILLVRGGWSQRYVTTSRSR
jgi:hypothetical protein